MSLQLKVASTETHDVHELAGRELICELRKTNMVLYGLFTNMVREFYMYVSPYIEGAPDVKWDRDKQQSRMWIDTELNWDAGHPEFLPAIYIKLSPVQYANPFGQGGVPATRGINLKDGIYSYVRHASTQVTFVHVGNNAGEACSLCDNTRAYLSDFAPKIAKDYVFSKFFENQATAIQQYKPDSKERYSSSAVFTAEWEETVSLKLESPILRSIDVESLQTTRKYGILSSRKGKPDLHTGDQR